MKEVWILGTNETEGASQSSSSDGPVKICVDDESFHVYAPLWRKILRLLIYITVEMYEGPEIFQLC